MEQADDICILLPEGCEGGGAAGAQGWEGGGLVVVATAVPDGERGGGCTVRYGSEAQRDAVVGCILGHWRDTLGCEPPAEWVDALREGRLRVRDGAVVAVRTGLEPATTGSLLAQLREDAAPRVAAMLRDNGLEVPEGLEGTGGGDVVLAMAQAALLYATTRRWAEGVKVSAVSVHKEGNVASALALDGRMYAALATLGKAQLPETEKERKALAGLLQHAKAKVAVRARDGAVMLTAAVRTYPVDAATFRLLEALVRRGSGASVPDAEAEELRKLAGLVLADAAFAMVVHGYVHAPPEAVRCPGVARALVSATPGGGQLAWKCRSGGLVRLGEAAHEYWTSGRLLRRETAPLAAAVAEASTTALRDHRGWFERLWPL